MGILPKPTEQLGSDQIEVLIETAISQKANPINLPEALKKFGKASNQKAKLSNADKKCLKEIQILDTNFGTRIFVPQEIRQYIHDELEVEGIFRESLLGSNEDNLRTTSDLRYYMSASSVELPGLLSELATIESKHEKYDPNAFDAENPLSIDMLHQFDVLMKFLKESRANLARKFENPDDCEEITALELIIALGIKGKLFTYWDGSTHVCFSANSASIRDSFFGKYIQVRGEVITSNAFNLKKASWSFSIPYFQGSVKLSELGIQVPIKDSPKFKELVARGKLFAQTVLQPTYLQYEGTLERQSWYSSRKYRATGRVMIDIKAMRATDPDYRYYFAIDPYSDEKSDVEGLKASELTDEQYAVMSPYVYGFSFLSKVWGEMLVENLSPVKFRDEAYDMLVLPEDDKRMISALVDNSSADDAKDFIDGKGGGCIFLLAGQPGVGKHLV